MSGLYDGWGSAENKRPNPEERQMPRFLECGMKWEDCDCEEREE